MRKLVAGALTLPPIIAIGGLGHVLMCEQRACSSLATFATGSATLFLGLISLDAVPRLWHSSRVITAVVIGLLWTTAGVLASLQFANGH